MIRAAPQRISREELVNSLTHGFGLTLSIAGFAVLLILAILGVVQK
jgi:predicted membrane channel-forming protein YqfA (hemolysin III family)